jgi:hypothetical protein
MTIESGTRAGYAAGVLYSRRFGVRGANRAAIEPRDHSCEKSSDSRPVPVAGFNSVSLDSSNEEKSYAIILDDLLIPVTEWVRLQIKVPHQPDSAPWASERDYVHVDRVTSQSLFR